MTEYDKIPKADVDFDKEPFDIIDQWIDSYFELRLHCGKQVFKTQMWRMGAFYGWAFAFILGFCLVLK
jgi:hypothetical protein